MKRILLTLLLPVAFATTTFTADQQQAQEINEQDVKDNIDQTYQTIAALNGQQFKDRLGILAKMTIDKINNETVRNPDRSIDSLQGIKSGILYMINYTNEWADEWANNNSNDQILNQKIQGFKDYAKLLNFTIETIDELIAEALAAQMNGADMGQGGAE